MAQEGNQKPAANEQSERYFVTSGVYHAGEACRAALRSVIPRNSREFRGFTLIELLVVVAIIAILSGLLLPILLQARDKARKQAEMQATLPVHMRDRQEQPTLPVGSLPILDAVVLKMTLTSSYHRIGMDVFTRYRVDCAGKVAFRSANGADSSRVLLHIPFPDNALEARDVQMEAHLAGSAQPISPDELLYTKTGIYGVYTMPPRQALTADVSFTALGREQLDYALPPVRQIRAVAITLDMPGGQAYTLPDDALQPSAANPAQIRWEFKNLVSDRHLTVLIPGAQAPLARVLLLSRLVAIAVLLFGAGFAYLSEQARPGQLDSFRLGHFLLLALTYSLFFVIFAVLEFHGGLTTPVSMLVSAVFSLPLLVLHVSRVLNLHFAVTRVVPLAVFTLGLVVNGVYGGVVQDFVFIGAAIVLIGYVTITYQAWAAGRERYHQEQETAYAARRRALTERITGAIGGQMAALAGADAQAAAFLSEIPSPEFIEARARLEKARELVGGLTKEYEELVNRLGYVPDQAGFEATAQKRELDRKAGNFEERLKSALANLRAELAAYRDTARLRSASGRENEAHCPACGQIVAGSPFCPHCGAAQPERVTCGECGEHVFIPTHLLRPRTENEPPRPLYCPHCGARLSAVVS